MDTLSSETYVTQKSCIINFLNYEAIFSFSKKDNYLSNYDNLGVETQVEGSLARYLHPQYSKIHSEVRLILEKFIGRKLYNTYYYDRFYLPGQELTRHLDRPACEISVSVHISSNIKQDWAFYIKTPDGYKDST